VTQPRPETYIAYETTYLGTVKLHLSRMVSFFNPFASDFSLVHYVWNGLLLLGYHVIFFGLFRYYFIDF
jgi:hypothetical protein